MVKPLPLVSIVTPSFNQGQFLEETIVSILKQDYPNIEYIIVDGGSTDNSVEIINKYEGRLTWWVSEPDKGQTHALIKGFKKAKGKYLAWLCSDDVLEPSMVSLSVHFLENNPDAVLTYGNRTRIDSKGNIIGISKPYFPKFLFKYGIGLPQETVMFRHESYKQVGGLNIDLHMVMDYDLWCKLFKIGKFIYIPAFLGRFRSHFTNKSSLFTNSQQGKENGNDDYLKEFHEVYYFHFGKKISLLKRKIAIKASMFFRLLYMRTKRAKENLLIVKRIREDEK